ncbi:MAG: Type pilus assembly protein PilA [Patescibacteria group bacterium]|nr:Type pilus assembly protein PilA [Patescibacteria group bacterium]
MIKNYKKGFTLIELLVVIAIIGILASVVLISTSKTRESGNNAAIQANLGTIKLQAEILNTTNRCFGDATECAAGGAGADTTDCVAGVMFLSATDPVLSKALASANRAAGGDTNTLDAAQCVVANSGTAYAVAVNLRPTASPQTAWCVDSSGFSDMLANATTFNTSGDGTCE